MAKGGNINEMYETLIRETISYVKNKHGQTISRDDIDFLSYQKGAERKVKEIHVTLPSGENLKLKPYDVFRTDYAKGGKLEKGHHNDWQNPVRDEEFAQYLKEIGYTINGKEIEWVDYYNGKYIVDFTDETKIEYDSEFQRFMSDADSGRTYQSAKHPSDLKHPEKAIFNTMEDAKKFVNLIKHRVEDKPKINIKYKYLATKDLKTIPIPEITEADFEKFKGRDLMIYFYRYYDDDDKVYQIERVHTYTVSNNIMVYFTLRDMTASIWDQRVYINIKQIYLPTGKPDKFTVEAYKQTPMSDVKFDFDWKLSESIIKLVDEVKEILVPIKYKKGGAISGLKHHGRRLAYQKDYPDRKPVTGLKHHGKKVVYYGEGGEIEGDYWSHIIHWKDDRPADFFKTNRELTDHDLYGKYGVDAYLIKKHVQFPITEQKVARGGRK